MLPDRFAILADGAAAAVLAFSLDRARARCGTRAGAGDRDRGRGRGRWATWIPAAVAVLAVVPIIPLPYQTAQLPAVPAGWQAAFARLRLEPDARVLVVPIPNVGHTMAMRWQADTGEPGSMIGGYFLGPAPGTGDAMFDPMPARSTAKYWTISGRAASPPTAPTWRRSGPPWPSGSRPPSWPSPARLRRCGQVLIKLLGRPGIPGRRRARVAPLARQACLSSIVVDCAGT